MSCLRQASELSAAFAGSGDVREQTRSKPWKITKDFRKTDEHSNRDN